MKSTLPATHLLRQFLLFVLTVVFLLTLIRAAYGLWQYPKLADSDALVPLFLQGLRYDIALVGLVCIVPVILGTLLSMLDTTRLFARFLITLFLTGGLLLVLLLELITPWFLQTQGLRPDLQLLNGVENPGSVLSTIVSEHAIPLAVGALLCVLILIAFWSRMELQRFLKYRLSVPAALLLAILGGLACVVAIRSNVDLRSPALSLADSQISTDETVNDLALNTAYKTLYSLLPELNSRLLTTE
ncbi:MAG: hypothetical protein HKN42_13745 [Granulosicoccus sp.]|nr:hypothetical protein [Granulosicoccus sp.]